MRVLGTWFNVGNVYICQVPGTWVPGYHVPLSTFVTRLRDYHYYQLRRLQHHACTN